MHFICFALLFVFISISFGDDLQKYAALREQCSLIPSNPECLKLKSKFLDVLQKCQKINTRQQDILCQQIKEKSCAVFPTTCTQATTTTESTSTTQKRTKPKSKITTTSPLTTTTESTSTARKRTKPKSKITTTPPPSTTTTTTTMITTTSQIITNEEFVQVPVNPDELRTRGEYCVRHGKEKKCQQLLNNLKIAYSSCNKKKPQATTTTKPQPIDCHSFQTHLCIAFPKFPPCIKKTPTL
jgi:hypothetical protein